MKISFLLHFYQPHDQQPDILERVVNESYRPLVKGLLERPHAKIIVNITGALSKLLIEHGYKDVTDGLRTLAERGQIELTGTCMYHAFLPLIPEQEALRQVELNEEVNAEIYGSKNMGRGFFSPEMAINQQVFKIISKRKYEWVAVPQIASVDSNVTPDKLYRHSDYKDLHVFFRNKRVSSLILSSVVRDAESLINETRDLHDTDKYWFCVMDAETFGHHRIGHEKVLFQILDHDFFSPVTAQDLIADLEQNVETHPSKLRDCTWTNSEQDLHLNKIQSSFILWKDSENPIHNLQWAFVAFVISTVNKHKDKSTVDYDKARKLLDKAIASDQFWWASVKPWWSLEMIEQGAFNLKEVINVLYFGNDNAQTDKANDYYRKILDQAFEWQRSGYIRQKHLENSATYMSKPFGERTPVEWYNQIILEFEDEMNKATANKDFEKAVKWRDAIIKLNLKTDIYDVLHVVDELWSARQIPSVKPFLEHNWEELSDYVKEYLLSVKNDKELEAWKARNQLKKQ